MAADKVSAKIAADARQRIKDIEADYEKQKAEAKKEAEQYAERYEKETKVLAAEEAARTERGILSEARLSARRIMLQRKHELIEETLDKAVKKFTSSKKYRNLLAKIIKVKPKDAEVFLSPADKKRFGSQSWAKKACEIDIKGGVVLRGKAFDVNFSLDAAFNALKEDLNLELSKILFE
ncbi:hypothetical protein GF359_09365 [candidate division WOR-3 bacterium]|uniref:V-type proton ATPase subunit E n=1 Tax=candidate division WOR-3 bacterium TaxID=2052148 RepID=A0A9D5KAD3_UNCW3|nr:hypothetical protein [candidate division WOR-3 bacterium]MBD3365407.1 hypothetical protein [candidate division WOR-3 bacterium]